MCQSKRQVEKDKEVESIEQCANMINGFNIFTEVQLSLVSVKSSNFVKAKQTSIEREVCSKTIIGSIILSC